MGLTTKTTAHLLAASAALDLSLLAGAGAQADTVTATWTGTVTSGHDQTGVFGAADADLAGLSFTDTFVTELGIGQDVLAPGSNHNYYPAFPR